MSDTNPRNPVIPSSILIIGAGVFGLSTAYALATHPSFTTTTISIIDNPHPSGASYDTSRIIRPDYAKPNYAALAYRCQDIWRTEYGPKGIYHETGLYLYASSDVNREYVRRSMENVVGLEGGKGVVGDEGCGDGGGGNGEGGFGYLNRRSGWADAAAAMRDLREKVMATQRVNFIAGQVQRLLFSSSPSSTPRVTGVTLHSGQTLTAPLTILATGAWSPSLLDLRGITNTTGQVLAYLSLSDEEADEWAKTPVKLDLSTGMFVIPPPPAAQNISLEGEERRLYLKVARHGFGYENPKTVPYPEERSCPNSDGLAEDTITVSLPATADDIPTGQKHQVPPEGLQACRTYLSQILPQDSPLLSRDFAFSRICHYADTPTGDFLIDYHPKYGRSLFVATGDSGHGFKFLPVIGEQIVGCLLGECPGEFVREWGWREGVLGEWEGDGSRGGRKGMVLGEEYERGGVGGDIGDDGVQ